jgi:hypothetical protein
MQEYDQVAHVNLTEDARVAALGNQRAAEAGCVARFSPFCYDDRPSVPN